MPDFDPRPMLSARMVSLASSLPVAIDATALAAPEQQLRQTVTELIGNRSDLALRDRLQDLAWAVLREWAIARCSEDANAGLGEVGDWSLGALEWLWVNTGLIHPGLLHQLPDPRDLGDRLSCQFSVQDASGLEVASLSTHLLGEYRRELDLSERLEDVGRFTGCREQLENLEQRIAALRVQRGELIPTEEGTEAATHAIQGLDDLLPHLAQLTWRGRGQNPTGRRARMQANVTARRFLSEVGHHIPWFRNRKMFEKIQSDLLQLTVQQLEAKQQWQELTTRLGDKGTGSLSVDDCHQAMDRALASLKRTMRSISRTPSFCVPPLVMERSPRVSARVISDTLDKILSQCPRLKHGVERRLLAVPSVLLLPGVGDAEYRAESGDIAMSFQPLEARLNSLIASLGEALVVGDSALFNAYALLRRQECPDENAMRQSFGQELVKWVESARRRKQPLDRKTMRWFKLHLVDQRIRPSSRP